MSCLCNISFKTVFSNWAIFICDKTECLLISRTNLWYAPPSSIGAVKSKSEQCRESVLIPWLKCGDTVSLCFRALMEECCQSWLLWKETCAAVCSDSSVTQSEMVLLFLYSWESYGSGLWLRHCWLLMVLRLFVNILSLVITASLQLFF